MDRKPLLDYAQQIQHLKDKGIRFEDISETDAERYLRKNNNLFKLSSYRKNFNKDVSGTYYLQLDFSHLIDLSVIDMYLRRIILRMSLDIEHFAKVKLMRCLTESGTEDGYSVVADYMNSLPPASAAFTKNEITRNKDSVYCGDAYLKYQSDMPVWVFIEIISFGTFVSFYKFCADRLYGPSADSGNRRARRCLGKMKDEFFLMLTVKHIRNAAAHNNCILNDLKTKSSATRQMSNWQMSRALSAIGIKASSRKRKISNIRVMQILTCLYAYREIVSSEKMKARCAEDLHELSSRFFQKYSYKNNLLLETTFDVLSVAIDKWFPV